jgi:hypothetical protein
MMIRCWESWLLEIAHSWLRVDAVHVILSALRANSECKFTTVRKELKITDKCYCKIFFRVCLLYFFCGGTVEDFEKKLME